MLAMTAAYSLQKSAKITGLQRLCAKCDIDLLHDDDHLVSENLVFRAVDASTSPDNVLLLSAARPCEYSWRNSEYSHRELRPS